MVSIDSIEFLAYLEEKHITANPELLNEIRIYKEQQSVISNRQQLKLSSQSNNSNHSSSNNIHNNYGGRSKSYDRSTLNHNDFMINNDDDDDVEDVNIDLNHVNNSSNNDISRSIELKANSGLIAIDEDKII